MRILSATYTAMEKSYGITISESLLEESGVDGNAVIEIKKGRIVIRRARHPREGWEEQAREMADSGDDAPLDPYIPTQFDLEEWEW